MPIQKYNHAILGNTPKRYLIRNETKIAYFSMEVALDHNMPTYSGGLGVLAGDTLRSIADLEVPVVGVTLLHKKGYFKQVIDDHGNQFEEDEKWSPEMHMEKLDVVARVTIEGRSVAVTAWRYQLAGIKGNIHSVLFLDTDLPQNSEYDRSLTDHLYGHDNHYRLAQEVILGIGGYRILKALSYDNIKKFHMNEGHSALLTLEIYKENRNVEETKKKCVFTTHTPVPAGHDTFPSTLAHGILGGYLDDDTATHAINQDALNMTLLGFHFSGYINAVAKQHGVVSRKMFPTYKIDSITNGIHSRYWVSDAFKQLFDQYLPGWTRDNLNLRNALSIPKQLMTETHHKNKETLFEYIHSITGKTFNPTVFTIGFARRAATYKRGDMLFRKIERLREIARKMPIQIVFSGKAHPRDIEGKQIIKSIHDHMNTLSNEITIVYLPNYNIDIGRMITSGVDVWLNTPIPPNEASGTSGMKSALNGVPHLSILDGWWVEGHIEGETGWTIGRHDLANRSEQDEIEDLYNKLEYLIMPTYYYHKTHWAEIMRNTIAINGSYFNTSRMVLEYVTKAYL